MRRLRLRIARWIVLCGCVLLSPRSTSAQALLSQIPVTNGGLGDGSAYVSALAKAGNTVYVGGSFDYIGPATGSAALLDPTTGAPVVGFPKVDSSIDAIASDGAGGWFIGGNFHNVGGVPRNGVAHIKSDLSVDSWSTTVNGRVRALAVIGSSVFVGGGFLKAFDATTGSQLAFDAGQSLEIRALAASGSTLFVGGTFSSVGGQPRQNLAALDAVTGSALSSWTANANNTVQALLVDGSTLYVGGGFGGINGLVRNGIAAVDASTGALSSWAPAGDGAVLALALQGTAIYAGGTFFNLGGQPRVHLAALSTSTGLATSWNPGADNSVNALAIVGSAVYAGGSFSTAAGQTRLRIAALDASTGLATAWNPGASAEVRALQASVAGVLAGGAFCSAGGKARNRLAAFDATTGAIMPWNPGADDRVKSIATDGTTVYLAGDFSNVGGMARSRLAAVSAATGVVTSWNPGADGSVWSIALSGTTLYAGGGFSTIGGTARSNIAAIGKSSGTTTSWNPAADATVTKVLPIGTAVYVGGVFANIGGQPRNNLAAIDATTGAATSWVSNTNGGGVYALSTDGTVLYLAGGFTAVGGALRNLVASVDLVTGIATAFNPNPALGAWGVGDVVGTATKAYLALAGSSDVMIQGTQRSGLAETQLPGGTLTGFNPPFFINGGRALLLDGSILYEAGDFAIMDAWGPWRRCLVAFDLSMPLVAVGEEQVKAGFDVKLSPNPTSGNVRIGLAIPRDSRVRVAVFDLQGRRVTTLLDRRLPAGARDLIWSGGTRAGARGDGIYFIRVEMEGSAIVRRVAIVGS
jgi:hypothetical protein